MPVRESLLPPSPSSSSSSSPPPPPLLLSSSASPPPSSSPSRPSPPRTHSSMFVWSVTAAARASHVRLSRPARTHAAPTPTSLSAVAVATCTLHNTRAQRKSLVSPSPPRLVARGSAQGRVLEPRRTAPQAVLLKLSSSSSPPPPPPPPPSSSSSSFSARAGGNNAADSARGGSMQPAQRVGHGFDLHRLEDGLPLILGGVTIEHDRGCAAHSDGDAVYHTVTDAVLGALTLPDIGQLFPDKDPQWKGATSDVFVRAAHGMMVERGYRVANLDVTVILERPKMSPYKERMRQNVAALLGVPAEFVNLKAKTHERVDSLGENRSVGCHAVVLLERVASDAIGNAAVEERADDSAAERVERSASRVIEAGLERAANVVSGGGSGNVATAAATATANAAADAASSPPSSPPPSAATTLEDTNASSDADILEQLYATIVSRQNADPSSSWTAKLLARGRAKIAQKVGEEAVEVVIEATRNERERVVSESADLLYHLMVLWADIGVVPGDVWAELSQRRGTSGVAERASRPGE